MSLDKAFEVDDGIVIIDAAGIASGPDDPSITGFNAPIGSLYLRTTGELYQKTGGVDTDWNKNSPQGSATIQADWEYDDTTTFGDPGAGVWRTNSTVIAASSFLRISQETKAGIDFSVILSAIDVGDYIYLQNKEDANEAVLFLIDAVSDQGTWYNFDVTVEEIGSETSFTDGKEFGAVLFVGTGSQVPESRTLTAGAGLTGGGDLSTNRTFDVGAGTGITVNADDIEVDDAYLATQYVTLTTVQTITGAKVFDNDLTVNQTVFADVLEELTAGVGLALIADPGTGNGTATWNGNEWILDSIDSPTNDLHIGWIATGDPTTPFNWGMKLSNASGTFFFMPNAPNPQIIVGDDTDTGIMYWDGNGNKDILFNALDTGPGVAADKQTGFGAGGIFILSTSGDQVNIVAPSLSADYTLTLPVDDGTPGQYLQTDGSGALSWQTIAGGGDVTAAANITDNSVVRGDGGAKGIQESLWSIDDNGMLSTTVNFAGHAIEITQNFTSGEFMDFIGPGGNRAHQWNMNATDGGIFRVFDGTANEVATFQADGGGAVAVDVSTLGGPLDFDWPFTVQGAATGNGMRILAGEILGDIALRISDQDDSFGNPGGAILEIESDQGFLTLGKSYAQTLLDNGVVYGIDQQGTGVSQDFNTQVGTYRIGGIDIVETYPACYVESGSTNITTTETTVDIDTEQFDPLGVYSNNGSGEITFTLAGYYDISYSIPVNDDGTGGSTRTRVFAKVQRDQGSGTWIDIAQSFSQTYTRESSGGSGVATSFTAIIAAGEAIRVRIDVQNATDVSTETGQAQISIHRVRRN